MPGRPPPDHRAGRQARLLRFLQYATLLTLVLSLVTVAAPGAVGRMAGGAVVATLVAVPLVRVAWLAQRWIRRRDWLYATVAGALLLIVGTAALIG